MFIQRPSELLIAPIQSPDYRCIWFFPSDIGFASALPVDDLIVMRGLRSNNGQLWQSFVFGWYQQWADCFPLAVTLHDIVHTDKSLTLVFEYLERDLKQYMDDCGAILSMNNVKLFLYQVLYPHGSCSWYSSRVFNTIIQLWEVMLCLSPGIVLKS